MNSRKSANKSPLHLRGSIDIVVEFFNYAINSILYLRGIYPSDAFTERERYGLSLLMITDYKIESFLQTVRNQMRVFLLERNVHKIVLVINRVETHEPVERWQFHLDLDKERKLDDNAKENDTRNPEHERRAITEIQEGLRGVMRQISASAASLQILEGAHSFDILLFTDKNVELPNREWSDMIARLISRKQRVRSRGTKLEELHSTSAALSSRGERKFHH